MNKKEALILGVKNKLGLPGGVKLKPRRDNILVPCMGKRRLDGQN